MHTNLPLYRQAVFFGIGRRAVMPRTGGMETGGRSGVARAMRARFKLFISPRTDSVDEMNTPSKLCTFRSGIDPLIDLT